MDFHQRLLINRPPALRALRRFHENVIRHGRIFAGDAVQHVIKRELGIPGEQPSQPMMSFSAFASVLASTRTRSVLRVLGRRSQAVSFMIECVGSTRSWPLLIAHELAAFIFKVNRSTSTACTVEKHPLTWHGSEVMSAPAGKAEAGNAGEQPVKE